MSHLVHYTNPEAGYLEMPSSSGTQYNNRSREMSTSSGTQYNNRSREMSSSSGTQYNNRNKTVCAICLQQLQNPRYLQCLHAFCEYPCLQSLLDRSENNIFNCPLCRQSYNARTLERIGSELVENESRPLLGETQEQRESAEQVASETNKCWKLVYTYAARVHFGIISIARIIIGFWLMTTSSAEILIYTSKLPTYQVVKGFIDILIALFGYCRSLQNGYTAFLIIVSTVCVTYGILAAWHEREIHRIQYHFLNDFSIYYGIVDGLMILCAQLNSRK